MIVLGHRGGRGDGWPAENSLEAFARAFEEGAAGVELDVRLCATGEPVILHDPTLARVTGGADRRPVHAVARRELPRLDGGLLIPDLESALDLARGRVVNVEVKADVPSRRALVGAVARAVERVRGVDVVLSSFDPFVVLMFAVVAPRVPRAILVARRTPRLATALPLVLRLADHREAVRRGSPRLADHREAVRRGPHAPQPTYGGVVAAHLEDPTVTAERVQRLRRARLRVVAWTVNDVARASALRSMGVEWLITDQPARILEALR